MNYQLSKFRHQSALMQRHISTRLGSPSFCRSMISPVRITLSMSKTARQSFPFFSVKSHHIIKTANLVADFLIHLSDFTQKTFPVFQQQAKISRNRPSDVGKTFACAKIDVLFGGFAIDKQKCELARVV